MRRVPSGAFEVFHSPLGSSVPFPCVGERPCLANLLAVAVVVVLLAEDDVVVFLRVEGWVKIDEVNELVRPFLDDRKAVAIVKAVVGGLLPGKTFAHIVSIHGPGVSGGCQ